MCSILGIFDIKSDASKLRTQALEMSKRMRHRGPDWSGIYSDDKAILVHERLSIVDVRHGAQPLYSKDKNLVLAVNGEIYNHQELKKHGLTTSYEFLTESDCEIILALYKEKGTKLFEDINGIFAFALYDKENNSYLIGRDHIGIIPLYTGRDSEGNFYVSSEIKGLSHICNHIEEFPPGHYLDSRDGEKRLYYSPSRKRYETVLSKTSDTKKLKASLEGAIHAQLMSDVPYGVLLSGGLDSSIISVVVKKFSSRRVETGDIHEAWWPKLHSFSIGLKGSPDLAAAREVADHIGTIHHEIQFTIQEGLDALRDVIYHIETYDVTTVRASTPMFLMARYIKSMGVKMVLSGEGADELFGGYLYFHKAPNAKAFHEETVRKLNSLHKFDCLRANKSMAAWGVEARVPFLDKEFMDVAMGLNPEDKRPQNGRMEKHILREAYEENLPEHIVWRQKEQFSDGVGYGWIDSLKEMTEKEVSDKVFENAKYKFPINAPQSKEEYYYRTIFSKFFPLDSAVRCVPSGPSVACSTPEALLWDKSLKNVIDPSGRAVSSIHYRGYKNPPK